MISTKLGISLSIFCQRVVLLELGQVVKLTAEIQELGQLEVDISTKPSILC